MLELATQRNNSLYDLVEGIGSNVGASAWGVPNGGMGWMQTISSPFPLSASTNFVPLTLNRILLSYSFMSQGLIQTVIKQPVEDAFRGGIKIITDELSQEQKKQLNNSLKKPRAVNRRLARKLNPNAAINMGNSDIRVMMDTMNWARLYGGAGMIINTDQQYDTELDVEAIREDSPLEFIAADRWELVLSQINAFDTRNPCPFNFYGLPIHWSRVTKVMGAEAPSYIRLRLQGWGMSEIERCIRSINSFVKFENLIFELLDEAKIDVYKIQGFNDSLLSQEGTENTQKRVMLGNRLKNYQNALAMDKEDDYMQKQITWSGLAEMWGEIRLNLSSSLKIPMNKLFGQSATGFGGGEDAIENYNSIVEGVRQDAEPAVMTVVDLRCQQQFGFIPDYTVEWAPLRIMDGTEEEEVKTKQQARTMELFLNRLVTGQEASQILRSENLLPMDTEVSKGLRDVEPTAPNDGDPSEVAIEADKEKSKAAAAAKPKPAAKVK